MQLTGAECTALAGHPATVIKALIEVVSTIPDLDQLALAVAGHPQVAALAHAYNHRHRELRAEAKAEAFVHTEARQLPDGEFVAIETTVLGAS